MFIVVRERRALPKLLRGGLVTFAVIIIRLASEAAIATGRVPCLLLTVCPSVCQLVTTV